MLGLNGCGKSTLLTAIGCRELPIPDHMDIHHLSREIEASDISALDAVISCDEERLKLEKEAEALAAQVCSSIVAPNTVVVCFWMTPHMINFCSRMMGVVKLLSVFMNDWMLWMHQLQKSVLLKFYLVLVSTSRCRQRRHVIFLVAGE